MNDFEKSTISKKSDQLNADDLIGGEKIIKVTSFEVDLSKEQPLSIHYEGENGKPYKPCLTMRKAILAAWGKKYEDFIGRYMLLFHDSSVIWGGEQVGGIRIKSMTHMDRRLNIKLVGAMRKKKSVIIEMMDIPASVDDKKERAQTYADGFIRIISQKTDAQELAQVWEKNAGHVARLSKEHPEIHKSVVAAYDAQILKIKGE